MPINGSLVLTFDRLLSPLTVTRQSLALRDAFNGAPGSPVIAYDPVARTVTVSSPSVGEPWLLPGQPYKLILPVPKDASDVSGLRAIDGATLERTLVVEFMTTAAVPAGAPTTVDYCKQVQPIFTASCTGGACHTGGGGDAGPPVAEGLFLRTSVGVRETAIGRASQHQTLGASSEPVPPGKRFGVNMPIIQPGSPGDSVLVYKLLANGDSEGIAPLPNDEASRLRGFIGGQPMPPPSRPFHDAVSTKDVSPADIELLSTWIAQGASAPDCP